MRVAILKGDDTQRSQVHGRVQPDLLLSELQGSLRVGAGELELAAMGGDHRDRQMDPGHLEPVLDVELVCAIGILGRELPAVAPQFDIGKPGQRVRGQQLVALMPFLVLALEERTRLLDAPTHVEHVRDRTVRLVQ